MPAFYLALISCVNPHKYHCLYTHYTLTARESSAAGQATHKARQMAKCVCSPDHMKFCYKCSHKGPCSREDCSK